MVIGILAHVDAGKTTLSEAMLFQTGSIRKMGRVDHKDAFLDNDEQERERGITIFSKQAEFTFEGMKFSLLDTPGHVDFSAEMERTLSCLDYAILVVSGPEGVQGHTRTLWRLFQHYNVPVFIYVNKMDLAGADREAVQEELKTELSDACVDVTDLFRSMIQSGIPTAQLLDQPEFSPDHADILENIACCDEDLMNSYMETETLSVGQMAESIEARRWFPCIYGSALNLLGVDELLLSMRMLMRTPVYGSEFSARVYKIGRDARGGRLTWLKVTGGSLKTREKLTYESKNRTDGSELMLTEKVDQIRSYNGEKFENKEEAGAGEAVAVTGLTATFPGQGLGAAADVVTPVLEPVLNYQLLLPRTVSPLVFMENMRLLEEEDPKLRVVWNEELKEIHVQLMGQIQMEVLTRMIRQRFGIPVSFGPGSIVYKETIAKPVEGVGHFEPLRHYAEVHLLLAPGEKGSGITVNTICSEDVLDRNWQRLIATHIEERVHKGVLTGSALTDVSMTIVTGRAHPKHTEGGDFRQATYRAIRQGLKSTESILLEPYYNFLLEIPMEHVGRALTDLEQRFARPEAPEFHTKGTREMATIRGTAPAACMQDYINEVHAYTQGLGSLLLELDGYDVCHNPEEVIEKRHYDSELDFRNPTGSVFCAQGSGYVVPWDEVPENMHMEYVFPPEKLEELWENKEGASEEAAEGSIGWLKAGLAGGLNRSRAGKGFGADEAENLAGTGDRRTSWSRNVSKMSEVELDKELADVYAREFGMDKEQMEEQERRRRMKKQKEDAIPEGLSGKPRTVKYDKHGNPIYPATVKKQDFLIVDGYNIIFSWGELKELSKTNIDSARDRLIDLLSNYQGYRRCRLAVVFDAYKVKDNSGKSLFYDGVSRKMTTLKAARAKAAAAGGSTAAELPQGIEVIYTKTDEIADARIERMVHDNFDKYRITVATNDGLEQLTILSLGAMRMTAKDLEAELDRAAAEGLAAFKR